MDEPSPDKDRPTLDAGESPDPGRPAVPHPSTSTERGVRPRVVVALAALIMLVATALLWWWLSLPGDGSVPLLPASPDATSTITYAGTFPPAGDPRLDGPSGVAVEATRVYVAESGRGVVREFAENGRRLRTLSLPVRSDVPSASPAGLAIVGKGILAVLDTAGRQVVLLDLIGEEAPIVVGASGSARGALRHPTAVAAVGGSLVVADSGDGTLKSYASDGRFLESAAVSATPPIAFISGMTETTEGLCAADSNGGRVVVLDPDTATSVSVLDRRFSLPRGVAPGPEGTLLVVEVFGRTLTHVDGRGGLIGTAGSPDGAALPPEGSLSLPRDVGWMASSSRAYISDARAGDVKVYNVTRVPPRAEHDALP